MSEAPTVQAGWGPGASSQPKPHPQSSPTPTVGLKSPPQPGGITRMGRCRAAAAAKPTQLSRLSVLRRWPPLSAEPLSTGSVPDWRQKGLLLAQGVFTLHLFCVYLRWAFLCLCSSLPLSGPVLSTFNVLLSRSASWHKVSLLFTSSVLTCTGASCVCALHFLCLDLCCPPPMFCLGRSASWHKVSLLFTSSVLTYAVPTCVCP